MTQILTSLHTFLTTLHIFLCFGLILVILLQPKLAFEGDTWTKVCVCHVLFLV